MVVMGKTVVTLLGRILSTASMWFCEIVVLVLVLE